MSHSDERRRSSFAGRRLHVFAGGLFVAVLIGWAVLMAIAARDADLGADRAGMVTAIFPPGTTIRDVFLATDRAGGSIVADTWFPNIWVLHSEAPGYAGRLREGGAILVLDTAPFQSMTIPTCGGV